MATEHTAQEISRLRRCVNDLASILGLPAIWTGHDSSRVTTTLLDVLVRLLDLDFAYARTADPANESPREWIRSADTSNRYAEAHEVGRALEPYLSDETPRETLRIANPVAEGTASIAVFHLGVQESRRIRRRLTAIGVSDRDRTSSAAGGDEPSRHRTTGIPPDSAVGTRTDDPGTAAKRLLPRRGAATRSLRKLVIHSNVNLRLLVSGVVPDSWFRPGKRDPNDRGLSEYSAS